jgi:hypothetical protein
VYPTSREKRARYGVPGALLSGQTLHLCLRQSLQGLVSGRLRCVVFAIGREDIQNFGVFES